MIGVLVNSHGIGMAEGALHFFEGWLFFLFCTAIIFAEAALLLRIGDRGRFLPFTDLLPQRRHFTSLTQIPIPPSFLTATMLIAVVGLGLTGMAGREEATPTRKALVAFPLTVKGGWVGRASSIDAEVLGALKLTDYLLADYALPSGRSFVNFYVAYYRSQRAGAAAHSPQACIPGGGWQIERHTTEAFDAAPDGTLKVNRLMIRQGETRQLVYYWFQQRGRNIADEYLVKAYLFWDALTRNRTDGALIRLATPLLPGEAEEAADRRLRDFLRAIHDQVGDYVPS